MELDTALPVRAAPNRPLFSALGRLGFVALAAMASAGCMISPEPGRQIAHRSDPMTFSGYASRPGASVVLEAYNNRTGVWEPIALTTATTDAHPAAGTIGNNPDLYYWTIDAGVSREGDSRTYDYWAAANCQALRMKSSIAESLCANLRMVRLRAREPGATQEVLATYDRNGTDCVIGKAVGDHEDFYQAAYDCRAPTSPETHVFVSWPN